MLSYLIRHPSHHFIAFSARYSRRIFQTGSNWKGSKGKTSTLFVDDLPIGPKKRVNNAKKPTEPGLPMQTKPEKCLSSKAPKALKVTPIRQISSPVLPPAEQPPPKKRAKKPRAVKVEPDTIAKDTVESPITASLSLPKAEDGTALSPLVRPTGSVVLDTVREIMARYPNCVLLTQVGEFYELYEHHAAMYGPLLDLKLTSKEISREHVNFTGFPMRSIDRYLDILVNKLGCHVALCDQYIAVGGGVRRKVSRIITPGTLIDEQFLNPYQHNYLLAVSDAPLNSASSNNASSKSEDNTIGLAWLDLSTGDFMMQKTSLKAFSDDLDRIRPREIILCADLERQIDNPLVRTVQNHPNMAVTYQPAEYFATQFGLPTLQSMFPGLQYEDTHNPSLSSELGDPLCEETSQTSLMDTKVVECSESSPLLVFSPLEISAATALLSYIDSTQMGRKPRLQTPTRFTSDQVMKIDGNALSSLELLRTMQNKEKNSFLKTIDMTETKAGSRLLSEWLTSPLTSVHQINDRLDIVEFFCFDTHLLADLRCLFKTSGDAQRAIQRLSLNRGQHSDLLDVRWTLEAMAAVKARLEAAMDEKDPVVCIPAKEIVAQLEPQIAVANFIRNAIDETRVNQKSDKDKEYGYVKRSFSEELMELYIHLEALETDKEILQQRLQDDFGSSVSLITSALYRHVVEINAKDAERLSRLKGATLIQQTRGKKHRYQVEEWTKLSMQIETIQTNIINEEAKVFEKTRDVILDESTAIIRDCRVLARLDVLASFATLAIRQVYVRPILNYSHKNNIRGGRHPVVESNLGIKGRQFVKNDCFVGEDQQIWLLTGPNMGGKSTFLRQNALISIMAQMGSYVSADWAEIGIVDRLFSRVGAADNLAEDQSTFMVEMLETATILRNATPRSLVIMDEVGRGTSTLDGLSIAYATLHHLYHHIQCRSIFATHYHELADMISVSAGKVPMFGKIGCYQTNVQEDDSGSFTFIHNVKPGVCRKSHGIHVAQLAGLPPSVLSLARQVLGKLETLEERSGKGSRVEEMTKMLEEGGGLQALEERSGKENWAEEMTRIVGSLKALEE